MNETVKSELLCRFGFRTLLRWGCVLILTNGAPCHSAALLTTSSFSSPKDHLTQLVEASASNQVDMLTTLLTNRADIDRSLVRPGHVSGVTPLIAACENGQVEAVEILLRHGANVEAQATNGAIGSGSALHVAAMGENTAVVQRLLSAGANPNAVRLGRFGGDTALHKAVGLGHEGVARMLLRAGADPNAHLATNSGRTCRMPLNFAAAAGFTNTVALLIAAGARIEGHPADYGHSGMTPLAEAAGVGQLKTVEQLIRAGASVGPTKDDRASPLHLAAAGGHIEVMEALLSAGANPNTGVGNGEMRGWTPLHFAAAKGKLEAARLLLERGADPSLSANGVTPILVAQAAKHTALQNILEGSARPQNTSASSPGREPGETSGSRAMGPTLSAIVVGDHGAKELIGPWLAPGVVIAVTNMPAHVIFGERKLTGGRIDVNIVGDKINKLENGLWKFDWASEPSVTGTLWSANGDMATFTKMTQTSAGWALTATKGKLLVPAGIHDAAAATKGQIYGRQKFTYESIAIGSDNSDGYRIGLTEDGAKPGGDCFSLIFHGHSNGAVYLSSTFDFADSEKTTSINLPIKKASQPSDAKPGTERARAERITPRSSAAGSNPASLESVIKNWPRYSEALTGSLEVRVKNPNDFAVRVGLRAGNRGRDFLVSANGIGSVNVSAGRYEIYFHYSTDADSLYQGDSFTLENNGAEITITKVVNGNYAIRKVK